MGTQPRNLTYSLIIVAITMIGCFFYWTSLSDVQETQMLGARHRSEIRVKQLNEAIEQQLDATLRSVDIALRHLRGVYVRDRHHFDQAVKDIVANYPAGMIQFVTVFGADGYLAYSSNGTNERLFFGDREHFLVHARSNSDQLFISRPIVGRITPTYLIQVTRPIWNGNRFLGVIGIPLRPDYLSSRLVSLQVAPTDVLAVVRPDGHIIARSHHLQEALQERLPSDRPFLKAEPGEHGQFRSISAIDKIPLLFAWTRLANWPLITVGAVNENAELDALSQQQSDERSRALLAIALALSFAASVAVLVLRISRKNAQLYQAKAVADAASARSHLLLTHASDGIHILDQVGNVIEASDSFCQMLGYTRSEVLGMNVRQWDVGFTPEGLQQALSMQYASQNISRFESRHRRKDGSTFDVEITGYALELDGRPALFNSSRDITERIHQEQIRIEREIEHRTTLVREVHHRIKNNLQSVAGLLQRELGKFLELDPRLEVAISQINVIAVTHGLQGSDSNEAIRLHEVVSNICQTVSGLKQQPVLFDPTPTPALVQIEISRDEAVSTALVINELILNAVKHSPPGSPAVAVTLLCEGQDVQLHIRNSVQTNLDFDFNNGGKGLGTGLNLVYSLLPEQGAELTYFLDRDGRMVTCLTLSPPVV